MCTGDSSDAEHRLAADGAQGGRESPQLKLDVGHFAGRAMKCYQCNTPAMYQVGEQNIPLCLDCYFKFTQIQQQQTENSERMMNYLSDEMSVIVGLPPMGPRFPPRPRPAVVAGAKLHNISVSNSVVGTINTGSIGTVDQSITALIQTGEPALAEAVKSLSEAILQSGDLTRNQKNELVESLSIIAKEAAAPKEARRNTVATALLERAMKVTALANDITDVCQKWWPVLLAAFSAATGD
jgi:hypothetical protein